MLLTSLSEAVFVTSKEGIGFIETSVTSLVVFPSVSSPSSLTSDTSLELPGLLAVADAALEMEPVLAASEVIM